MGAMKELLMGFCELVYPHDGEKQAQLARDIVGSPALCPFVQTVEQFRRVYEDTGVAPRMDLEQMQNLVNQSPKETTMLVVFVRFGRFTADNEDDTIAQDNFPHLDFDPRLQLLEQFKLELYASKQLQGHWTTLHSYDTIDEDSAKQPDFFVWVKFTWRGDLVSFCRTLQECYDKHGMAGNWSIIDAIGPDGVYTLEQIRGAVATALAT